MKTKVKHGLYWTCSLSVHVPTRTHAQCEAYAARSTLDGSYMVPRSFNNAVIVLLCMCDCDRIAWTVSKGSELHHAVFFHPYRVHRRLCYQPPGNRKLSHPRISWIRGLFLSSFAVWLWWHNHKRLCCNLLPTLPVLCCSTAIHPHHLARRRWILSVGKFLSEYHFSQRYYCQSGRTPSVCEQCWRLLLRARDLIALWNWYKLSCPKGFHCWPFTAIHIGSCTDWCTHCSSVEHYHLKWTPMETVSVHKLLSQFWKCTFCKWVYACVCMIMYVVTTVDDT